MLIGIIISVFFMGYISVLFGTSPSKKVIELCKSVKDLYSIHNDNVILFKTIDLPDNSSTQEILEIAGKSVRDTYQKNGFAIQNEDMEEQSLFINGTFPAFYSKKASGRTGLYCEVAHTLKAEVKKNKVRIGITLLAYNNSEHKNVEVNTVYPVEIKKKYRRIAGVYYHTTSVFSNKIKVSKSRSGKYFYAAVTTANSLLEDIEKSIKTPDDDW